MTGPLAGPLPETPPAPLKERIRRGLRPALGDAVVVAAWFAVLGLVGAVVWEMVTPLAAYTRTAENGTMGEEELARQFGATGWYVVVAAAGGVLSGLVLLLLRRRNPVLVVVLVALGGALATLVMVRVGLEIGPADPNAVLPSVDVGDEVPLRLRPEGSGVYLVWSIAALAGAMAALLFFESRDERSAREERLRLAVPRNG